MKEAYLKGKTGGQKHESVLLRKQNKSSTLISMKTNYFETSLLYQKNRKKIFFTKTLHSKLSIVSASK